MRKSHFMVSEVCEQLGINEEFVSHCIEAHWVVPALPETTELDEEDVARLSLIRELKEDFGANDESIPVILHLLDQLYFLRSRLGELKKAI